MRGDLNRAPRCCTVAILRGRETVRADRRLRTDEKHIRAQSAISYDNPMFFSVFDSQAMPPLPSMP
jgi:hypothetical protein